MMTPLQLRQLDNWRTSCPEYWDCEEQAPDENDDGYSYLDEIEGQRCDIEEAKSQGEYW